MQSKLGKKDLLDFIGEEAAKGGSLALGGGSDEAEKKRIKRGHTMAVSVMTSYLKLDLIKIHVGNPPNAYDVWKSLEKTYKQSTMENAVTYKMKLEALKFSDFEDLPSYLSDLMPELKTTNWQAIRLWRYQTSSLQSDETCQNLT